MWCSVLAYKETKHKQKDYKSSITIRINIRGERKIFANGYNRKGELIVKWTKLAQWGIIARRKRRGNNPMNTESNGNDRNFNDHNGNNHNLNDHNGNNHNLNDHLGK